MRQILSSLEELTNKTSGNCFILHQQIQEKFTYPSKVIVWCGVARFGLVGPYFFEDDWKNTVTVNSDRYVKMVRGYLIPKLRQLEIDITNILFQQNGKNSHNALSSIAVLREMFPKKFISRFGDVPKSVRSPDLTSCDCWLWG